MNALIMASLVAASVLPSAQAAAAGLDSRPAADVRTGAFAGARLRVPLGAAAERAKPQFDLAVAPMMLTQRSDGHARLRFGEGVSFGFTGRGAAQLSLAGRAVSGLAPQQGKIDTRNAAGVSTLGWVAIGTGLLLIGGGLLFVDALNDASD